MSPFTLLPLALRPSALRVVDGDVSVAFGAAWSFPSVAVTDLAASNWAT